MSPFVKIMMVMINIYHFFFKNEALWPCVDNLWRFLRLKPSFQMAVEKKKTVEILYIGFLAGIVFMPGANNQFR
jgi:hypothetical protein